MYNAVLLNTLKRTCTLCVLKNLKIWFWFSWTLECVTFVDLYVFIPVFINLTLTGHSGVGWNWNNYQYCFIELSLNRVLVMLNAWIISWQTAFHEFYILWLFVARLLVYKSKSDVPTKVMLFVNVTVQSTKLSWLLALFSWDSLSCFPCQLRSSCCTELNFLNFKSGL